MLCSIQFTELQIRVGVKGRFAADFETGHSRPKRKKSPIRLTPDGAKREREIGCAVK